jgi:phosphopantetheinyl transferase (holo-ACP synthase)
VTGCQIFFALRDFLRRRNPQNRKEREDAAEAARLWPAKEAEVKALQQRVDSEVAKERIRLEKERDALMAKVLKVGKTSAQSSANQTRFGLVLINVPAEREQWEVFAALVCQLDPRQTTPRFKELLKRGTALEPFLPVKIVTGVSRADAVALANKLKKGGAKVEIENEQPD